MALLDLSPLRNGPLPLHVQAERALRSLIAASSAGDLLPPEMQLASELGVSRNTVRQAMDRLVAAGLVTRTAGRGTEVLPRRIDTHLDFTPFLRAFEATGHSVSTTRAELSTRPADDEEAEALRLPAGTEVRELVRVRVVDDKPFAYLQTVLAPGIPVPEDLSGSLYEALEGFGIHLTRLSDVVSAVNADSEMARILAMRRGAALLVVRRTAYAAHGEPVEFSRSYLRAETGYVAEHTR